MSKSAVLTAIAVLLAVAVVAGAIVITYCQYGRYTAACSSLAEESRQQRVLEERVKEERTRSLKKMGALVELKLVKDESGQIILKAGERTFGTISNERGEKLPDYRALYDYIARSMKELQEKPHPPALKVVIDSAEDVEMKHVVHALNECVRAGVKDVEFAAPDIPGLDD
jgi:hypothetical protein